MKRFAAILLLTAITAGAQQQPKTAEQAPTLSAADVKALSDIAQQEQELQKQFAADESLKAQIIREWEAAHPGYKINSQTGAVTKVEKPSASK